MAFWLQLISATSTSYVKPGVMNGFVIGVVSGVILGLWNNIGFNSRGYVRREDNGPTPLVILAIALLFWPFLCLESIIV